MSAVRKQCKQSVRRPLRQRFDLMHLGAEHHVARPAVAHDFFCAIGWCQKRVEPAAIARAVAVIWRANDAMVGIREDVRT